MHKTSCLCPILPSLENGVRTWHVGSYRHPTTVRERPSIQMHSDNSELLKWAFAANMYTLCVCVCVCNVCPCMYK